MSESTPNLRKGYAIVRIALFQGDDVEWKNKITVKKIVWSEEIAEQEVARLNELNHSKECLYFWQATQIV